MMSEELVHRNECLNPFGARPKSQMFLNEGGQRILLFFVEGKINLIDSGLEHARVEEINRIYPR
jgi:hypothetical protein